MRKIKLTLLSITIFCVIHVAAQPGNTCNEAIPINANLMFGEAIDDFWYQFTPTENGIYGVNTCPNFNVQANSVLNTSIWIYDDCPTTLSDGPAGAIAYSELLSTCANGAGFTNLLLLADTTYYIRVAYLDTFAVDEIILSFFNSPDAAGCTDINACNYDPFAVIDVSNCIFDEDCLPDLVINQNIFESSIFLDQISVTDGCLLEESCVTGIGLRDIVRFSTQFSNDGNADYILGNPNINDTNFSDDNCHDHWHSLSYAEYLLYSGAGVAEPIGLKNGFCVLDFGCSGANPKFTCNYMGVTAGCYDLYDFNTECQWIDVTDVADGDYTVVNRVNWAQLPDLRGKQESNYINNWAQVCINLDRSSGSLVMTINEDCPNYIDCAGTELGSLEVDCEGVCGGAAHFGDINQNGTIDDEDVEDYLTAAINQTEITNCSDLNADGTITLYDAALLAQCYSQNGTIDETTYHQHCIFPAGIETNDSVSLSLENLDAYNQTFEIHYTATNKNIIGIQLAIEGIEISFVENILSSILYPLNSYSNNNNLILFSDSIIASSNQNLPIAKVHYSTITQSDTICISSIIDVVDKDYFKTATAIKGDCLSLNTTNTNTQIITNEISISNPATNTLFVTHNSIEIIEFTINNISGKQMMNGSLNNKSNSINIQTLVAGLYYIQFKKDELLILNKKFVVAK